MEETIKKTSAASQSLLKEIIAQLNEPLPPEAISQHPTKPYLSTIKAIYVVERFNQVFGLGGWFINNEFVEKVEVPTKNGTALNVVVKSTFQAPGYGITVPDIFGGNDNPDLGDAYKGACTDALTKIGSYLGVGMDVYKGLGDKAKAKPWIAPQKTQTGQGGQNLKPSEPLGDAKATLKQINLIKTLVKQKGQENKVTEEKINQLSLLEAKKWIDKLLKMENKDELPTIEIEADRGSFNDKELPPIPYKSNHEGD